MKRGCSTAIASRLCPVLVALAVSATCGPAFAQDVDPFTSETLEPEEKRQLEIEKEKRELERKRAAPPVLVVDPKTLAVAAMAGEALQLQLTIRNEGGQVLAWSFASVPAWLQSTTMRGELRYDESATVRFMVAPADLSLGPNEGRVVVLVGGDMAEQVVVPVSIVVEAPDDQPDAPAEPVPPVDTMSMHDDETPATVVDSQDDVAPLPASFGVRLGALLPSSSAGREYAENPTIGFFYGLGPRAASRISAELAIDIAGAEESAGYESVPIAGRADFLFRIAGRGDGVHVYALGGGVGYAEFVEQATSGETYINFAGGVEVGIGFVLAGGRLDVRFADAMLLGSENIANQGTVSLGYSF